MNVFHMLLPFAFHESCLLMVDAFLFCRKLRDLLQQRLIKFFVDQSKKDPEKYAKFFEDYGLFMREGIVTTAEQEVKVGSLFLGLSLGCRGLWRNLVEARNLNFLGRDRGIAGHFAGISQGSVWPPGLCWMQQAWRHILEPPYHVPRHQALPRLMPAGGGCALSPPTSIQGAQEITKGRGRGKVPGSWGGKGMFSG